MALMNKYFSLYKSIKNTMTFKSRMKMMSPLQYIKYHLVRSFTFQQNTICLFISNLLKIIKISLVDQARLDLELGCRQMSILLRLLEAMYVFNQEQDFWESNQDMILISLVEIVLITKTFLMVQSNIMMEKIQNKMKKK